MRNWKSSLFKALLCTRCPPPKPKNKVSCRYALRTNRACRRAAELSYLQALADALERDDERIDDVMSAVVAALQTVGRLCPPTVH